MNPIKPIIDQFGLFILDGALATHLEVYGCDLNDPLWSAKILLENPELIKRIHTQYFEAGADCAITASYQATFEGFAGRGLTATEAADLMRLTVALAVEARNEFWANPANRHNRPRPLIAASVGSYGAYLADGSEYRGDYGLSEEALMTFHRRRLAVLTETEADLVAFETVPSRLEAQALANLLTEFPQQVGWLSFSAKDGQHISDGSLWADCVQQLDGYPQIIAIGINCTPPRFLPKLIEIARTHTNKPIVVYPNSGEAYDPISKVWLTSDNVANYGDQARIWYDCGARIIGGCCRTTPQDIQEVAVMFRTFSPQT